MLSIVSDGTFENAKVLHNRPDGSAVDIKDGLTSCEIIMEPGKPTRAVLIYDHVEVGMTVAEPEPARAATDPVLAGHRPLSGG